MKKTMSFGILVLILISSCKINESFTDHSAEAISCVNSRDSILLVNLDKYEQYLIQAGLIRDESQSSYIDLIDKYLKGQVELNVQLMGEYVFEDGEKAWEYISPAKFAIFVGCIHAGKENHEDKDYYNLAGKVLMNTLSTELEAIGIEHNIHSGVGYFSIEHSDIPEEMFENKFIHYCFLVSLYQLLM